ncbi:CDCA2 protein, partial [Grantiella picta]|nr:CDCA2 protein [Grantiella picta]
QSPGGDGAALSPRKVGFGEDVILGMLGGSQTPTTPVQTENIPSSDLSQSSSLFRSILKKTPGREILDSPTLCSEPSLKEYSNNAIDRGGGEAAAVSSCVKTFEMLQTDTAETQSSKTPKKKKVTFGEVLSPEIFDQTLPANTPLRRGASPGCPRGPNLRAEPLPLLDFAWDEECVEPPQEILEDSVAVEAPSPAEKTEAAEINTTDMVTISSSTKRKQSRAVPENSDCESGAPDTQNDQDTKNPTKSKIQRQKNPTTAAPK